MEWEWSKIKLLWRSCRFYEAKWFNLKKKNLIFFTQTSLFTGLVLLQLVQEILLCSLCKFCLIHKLSNIYAFSHTLLLSKKRGKCLTTSSTFLLQINKARETCSQCNCRSSGRTTGWMSGDFVLCVALPWFDLWYFSNHSVFHPLSGLSRTDWQSFGAESTLFLHICVVPNTKESQSALSTVQTHNWKCSFFLWDLAISAKGQQRDTSNRWKTQVNSALQLLCLKRRSWFALQNMAFAWFWRPPLKLSEHSTSGHFSVLSKWKQTNFMVE